MTKSKNKKLTDKEQAFVHHYLIEPSAPDAAEKAGYAKGRKEGSNVLKRPHIREAIKWAQRERSVDTGIDANWVLTELARCYKIAINDVKPSLNSHGKPIKDADGHSVFRVELGPALKALEQIAKHVDVDALAANRTENLNQNVDLKEMLWAARHRVAERSTDGVEGVADLEAARQSANKLNGEARSYTHEDGREPEEAEENSKVPTGEAQFYITGKGIRTNGRDQ